MNSPWLLPNAVRLPEDEIGGYPNFALKSVAGRPIRYWGDPAGIAPFRQRQSVTSYGTRGCSCVDPLFVVTHIRTTCLGVIFQQDLGAVAWEHFRSVRLGP